MEQKNFPFLRNWNLSAHNNDIIIKGSVFGHAQIADSRKIKTSPVQKVAFSRESWERLYFYTHNTVYECPLNQVDPTCQFTKNYLRENIPEEQASWDNWLNDDPTRPDTPFENVDLPVPDGAFLLALDADSPHLFQGVFQKYGNKYHWIIRRPYVNMGMFTDSVLSNKYDDQLNLLFDVRYFPQGVQELRFYGIKFGGENILFYVVNVGNCNIIYDGKNLESWHYFQLLEKTQDELEEEEPLPELPQDQRPTFRIQEENRPTMPSRLLNSPYYAENPPDLTPGDPIEEELPNQMSLFSEEENQATTTGFVDLLQQHYGDSDPETWADEAENPANTADFAENQGEYQAEPPFSPEYQQEQVVYEDGQAQWQQPYSDPTEISAEMQAPEGEYYPESADFLPESTEYTVESEQFAPESQEIQEEPVPRKSLLEEALEFEKNSIPPKPQVEIHDEEESREQVLFSSLALYGLALEEIPLETNENSQEVETFNEVPALNLEHFPEEDQGDIAQLSLGKNREIQE